MATNRAQLASRVAARTEIGGETRAVDADLAADQRALREQAIPVAFRGRRLWLRIPSLAAIREAKVAARKSLRAQGIDPSNPGPADQEDVGMEKALQLLARSLRVSAEPDAPLVWATADDFDEDVNAAELSRLLGDYVAHEQESSGDLGDLSRAAYAALVEAVKKKDRNRWNAIASDLPRSSLLSLVDQLASSLSSSSSSTTPDEVP